MIKCPPNTQFRLNHHCYESCLWITDGKIGDEFISKHTLLITHAWIIHKRLLIEGAEGLRTQEAMFDELWEDTCARLRAIGINELSINKHLGEVQTHSFNFCMELDEALKKETESETLDDMGGALWRNAYSSREDLEEDHIMEFAKWVLREFWMPASSCWHLSSVFLNDYLLSLRKLCSERTSIYDGNSLWSCEGWSHHMESTPTVEEERQRFRKELGIYSCSWPRCGTPNGHNLFDMPPIAKLYFGFAWYATNWQIALLLQCFLITFSTEGVWVAALSSGGKTYYWWDGDIQREKWFRFVFKRQNHLFH